MERDEMTDERKVLVAVMTDKQIRALEQEAAAAGDDATVRDCRTILSARAGDQPAGYYAAVIRVAAVLDEARARAAN